MNTATCAAEWVVAAVAGLGVHGTAAMSRPHIGGLQLRHERCTPERQHALAAHLTFISTRFRKVTVTPAASSNFFSIKLKSMTGKPCMTHTGAHSSFGHCCTQIRALGIEAGNRRARHAMS